MEDEQIIGLFFDRCEDAIEQTKRKYGSLCKTIAGRILQNPEDAEECVSDTYLALWDAIPPARPEPLSAFAAKITRNLALKRLEQLSTAKRNGEAAVSFEELSECLCDREAPDRMLEELALRDAITDFLQTQDKESRCIFLRRYFFFDSVGEIAQRYGLSQSKVKSRLMRTRNKLRLYLIQEGLFYER